MEAPGEGIYSDPVTATLQGNITDENDQPVSGAVITAGIRKLTTNGAGYFRITGASLDKNISLVTAEKTGYFKGYRVFSATTGTNQVLIKLIKKKLAGTINASSGGNTSLPNGATITLPANGVVVAASGNAYSGDVKVYASYIDPQSDDIGQTVPGSFAASDKKGERAILSSYGMLVVEMASSTGNQLQIKTGAVATLSIPISSKAALPPPSSIALWYVDEKTGIWKEEGTATRQGNNYVGEVKHFSYWNCDQPFKAVTLSLTLINAKGLPLVNVRTKLTDTDAGISAYGYTDSSGQVKGLVPFGRQLVLAVLDECNNVIHSQTLAPLTVNTDLGLLPVGATGSFVTVTGRLLDCSGTPVKKGYAVITSGNIVRYAATDAAGLFNSTFSICSGNYSIVQVTGTDQSLQQQGRVSTTALTAPVTNAGDVLACGVSIAQYINYTLDGISYSITSAAGDSIYASLFITGGRSYMNVSGSQQFPGLDYLSFDVYDVASTGRYPVRSVNAQLYSSDTLLQPFIVTFTKFAKSTGEFFEGSFSGKFKIDSLSGVHSITTSFSVRKSN